MLVAFNYAFPHKKSYEGLMALLAAGLKPDLVVGAGYKKLNIKYSPTRISPQGLTFPTSEQVCSEFGIDYLEADHDSTDLAEQLAALRPSSGVILGARILKDPIISTFSKGILNLHPGVLPDNRGLDNLKWAIVRNLPQGVTSHLIDAAIDRGLFIKKEIVDVYPDDSLLDINLRIQNVEMRLMTESLIELESRDRDTLPTLGEGEYHTAMDAETDARMLSLFEGYKAQYAELREAYEQGQPR